MEVADAGVLRRQDVALADLRRRQVLTAAVDICCADILIVHRDDVTVVAARVTLFVR
jgi:hypothetical protein